MASPQQRLRAVPSVLPRPGRLSLSAITAADRRDRWKKVHPRFKEWCGAQRPQVKCGLESWDDVTIKNRFFAWLIEQPPEPAQDVPPHPTPAEPVPDPNGPYPPDFKDYIAAKTPSKKPSGKVLRQYWQDETTRGLFALWRKERAARTAR